MSTSFSYSRYYGAFSAQERCYTPKELYWRGDISLLEKGLKISVAGSRNMTPQGERDAVCIARTLVDHKVIFVSGLAERIDTTAHMTAIASGGKTIAVLGTPLEVSFPAANRQLQEQIMRDHLAISQFEKCTPVGKQNFPIRNRTMALITEATIIVEAFENSVT